MPSVPSCCEAQAKQNEDGQGLFVFRFVAQFLGPGEVGVGFHIVPQLTMSNAPGVVGLGKVGVYSNRLAVITIRLGTEEVSRV